MHDSVPDDSRIGQAALATAAVAAAQVGLVVFDAEGMPVLVNPAFCSLVGRSADQLIGRRPPFPHWPPERSDEMYRLLEQARRGAVPAGGHETEILHPDGRRIPTLLKVAPLGAAEPGGWVATFFDLTPLRVRERALQDSEWRFRELAEHIEEVFYVFDASAGRVTFASPSFARVWGIPVDALYADPAAYLRAIAPEYQSSAAEARTLQARGEITRREYRLCRPDGTDAWIWDQSFPILDERGHVARVVGIASNITQRKRSELALQASEAKLRQAQVAARLAFWTHDYRSGETQWSSEMYSLLGYEAGAVAPGLPSLLARVHAEDVGRVRSSLARPSGATTLEFRIVRPQAETAYFVSYLDVVLAGDGTPVSSTGTLQDVSERRRTDERLRHAQKLEALGQMTGGLAHDFNNLLGIVIGSLDRLTQLVGDDPEARQLNDTALSAALRGAEVTRSLLAVARRQPMEIVEQDLNRRIVGLLPLIRHTAGPAVQVHLALAPRQVPARIDASGVDNAIVNLVMNARDAMPEGGSLTISTALETVAAGGGGPVAAPGLARGRYAVLCVADTGVGMSEETAARAFDPFFTTKERGRGTGLGLPMVEGLARQLGGGCTLSSAPGTGTVVKVFLPRGTAVRAQAVRPRPAAPRGSGTVLVVDDEVQLAQIAVAVLRSLGYEPSIAHSAGEAESMLRERSFDILFTDIVMPGAHDGIWLARWAAEHAPDMAIVLTTGFTASVDLASLPWPVLEKPYRRAGIAHALANRRTRTAGVSS